MKKWHKGIMAVCIAVSLAMETPVFAAKSSYTEAVDILSDLVLALDEAWNLYEQEMDEVNRFLNGEGELSELRVSLPEAAENLEKMGIDVGNYEIPENAEDILAGCGIEFEDYYSMTEYLDDDIYSMADDLDYLYQKFLVDENGLEIPDAEVMENIAEFQETHSDLLAWWELLKNYYYYMYVNYCFAEWEEEAMEIANENLLDQLTVLTGEGLEWETSRADVEEKIIACLEYQDRYLLINSAEIAKAEEELYRMQQEMEGQ